MRRLTPGRGPSSRPGQLCAVEEIPSQKLDSLSRNRRLSRVSSIPARQFQAGCPLEKPIPKTKTKKNEPTGREIYNRTTPGEKSGLAANSQDRPALHAQVIPTQDKRTVNIDRPRPALNLS